MPLTIRQAAPADADEVAALFRQSFRPEDLALTIYGCSGYGCPGITEYLRLEFALPPELSASTYLVAEMENRLAGYVEMRGLHLNYIVVDENCRGAGVGTALRASGPATLDVFEHNRSARSWYERAGYRELRRTAFWRVTLPDGRHEAVRITGWAQSEAAQRAFGFSQFDMAAGDRRYTIGRLGDRWFRVTDGELVSRPDALRGLLAADSRREILYVGAEVPEFGSPLLWSIRMGRQS
jgi:ribosomal protein S18 acetylase RimI-like enzyme